MIMMRLVDVQDSDCDKNTDVSMSLTYPFYFYVNASSPLMWFIMIVSNILYFIVTESLKFN